MKVSDCLFSFQDVYGLPIANMSFDSLILTLDRLINLQPFFDAISTNQTQLRCNLWKINATIKDLQEDGTMVGPTPDAMISLYL